MLVHRLNVRYGTGEISQRDAGLENRATLLSVRLLLLLMMLATYPAATLQAGDEPFDLLSGLLGTLG